MLLRVMATTPVTGFMEVRVSLQSDGRDTFRDGQTIGQQSYAGYSLTHGSSPPLLASSRTRPSRRATSGFAASYAARCVLPLEVAGKISA